MQRWPHPLHSGRRLALTGAMATALLHSSCTCGDGPSPIEATRFDAATAQGTTLALATADTPPQIFPVQRGELQAPPSGQVAGQGVQVLAVGPQGEQEQPMQAVVVFDRPMVALGALDDPASPVPLSCGPNLAGKARWAGTSTAVWIPEGNDGFPRATEVHCSVPGGTLASSGEVLERELGFDFQTPAPSVQRHWPRHEARSHDPATGILLVFDQPMDPMAVAAASTLQGRDGRVPLSGVQPPEDPENWRLPDDLQRAVLLTGPMARDTAYTLTVASGLQGLEGPRATKEDQRFVFNTIPPAAIDSVEPRGSGVDPHAWIKLRLATSTPAMRSPRG